MAIKSHAFGRVTLTDDDATKFRNLVSHGKPKPVAVENVRLGVEVSRSLRANGGKISLQLKRD